MISKTIFETAAQIVRAGRAHKNYTEGLEGGRTGHCMIASLVLAHERANGQADPADNRTYDAKALDLMKDMALVRAINTLYETHSALVTRPNLIRNVERERARFAFAPVCALNISIEDDELAAKLLLELGEIYAKNVS